ncbi:MAG: hypothetical protein JXJ22_11885 [Bacteroidales bacterium]|nr:hypothetical protein [Bacteroidales bacterium]
MDNTNQINRLINKYGLILIISFILVTAWQIISSELIIDVKFKSMLADLKIFGAAGLSIIMNIISVLYMIKDSKKYRANFVLIIIITLLNNLIGIIIFLIKILSVEKIKNASVQQT